MSDSFVTPWTVACQSPLSKGFPWREYWSGLPFPSPGDLPDVGIKPMSTALAGKFFTIEPPGKKMVWFKCQSEEQSSVCVCVCLCMCVKWVEMEERRLFLCARGREGLNLSKIYGGRKEEMDS